MSTEEFDRIMMTLAKMQGREFDNVDLDLWERALAGYPGSLVAQALEALWATSNAFITPASLRERMEQIASERLTKAPHPLPPPVEMDPVKYLRWQQAWRDAVISGDSASEATLAALEAVGIRANALPRRNTPAPALTAAHHVRESLSRADD